MNIRKALYSDLDRIEEIYDSILSKEAETVSYTNWQKGIYPTRDFAENALKEDELFCAEENGCILASMLLNSKQLDEYSKIPWHYIVSPEEVLVIHTLCVDPAFSGRGIASLMVEFAENYARSHRKKVIRLDTYEGNLPACKMYPKLGYEYAGTAEFLFQKKILENLNCFEKLL